MQHYGDILISGNILHFPCIGSRMSRRGAPTLQGAPTPDAAVFYKMCVSKRKIGTPRRGLCHLHPTMLDLGTVRP